MKKLITFAIMQLLLIGLGTSLGQSLPPLGNLPSPNGDVVAIRFVDRGDALDCDKFALTIRLGRKAIVKGVHGSPLSLSMDWKAIPRFRTLEVIATCGQDTWHFSKVPVNVLRAGWWEIGTDVPPFQPDFSGERFSGCTRIVYFTSYPSDFEGFSYFETSPPTQDGSKLACTGRKVLH